MSSTVYLFLSLENKKSKDILKELDQFQEKKNTLMQEYSKSNDLFSELVQYKRNYENYMDKEVKRENIQE